MKIDGSCQCGAITFEAEIDPKQVNICHCTDCQAFSGSAFRVSVPAAAKDFKLLSGEPKAYVKTAESGNKRVQMFCPTCGSHLYTVPSETDKGASTASASARSASARRSSRRSRSGAARSCPGSATWPRSRGGARSRRFADSTTAALREQ